MKKILLSLGGLSTILASCATVISCGADNNTDSIPTPQKDVDKVLSRFIKANLVLNPQKPVAEAKGDFNLDLFKSLGGDETKYPHANLPDGVSLTYSVKSIADQASGNLTVTISKKGVQDKNFNALVYVTPTKLVNIDTSDKANDRNNLQYDSASKTLTIGNSVGQINFDLSSIFGNIEKINWGTNPKNILKIGDNAFASSAIKALDFIALTNLTAVGVRAFYEVQMTDLSLANLSNLKFIGNEAFDSAKLDSLDLSGLSNLNKIDYHAFESINKDLKVKMDEASFKKLIYDKDNSIDNRTLIFGKNNGDSIKRVD